MSSEKYVFERIILNKRTETRVEGYVPKFRYADTRDPANYTKTQER